MPRGNSGVLFHTRGLELTVLSFLCPITNLTGHGIWRCHPPASCILPGQPLGKWWLVGYAGRIWDLCHTSHEKHFLGHWAMDRHCPPKGGVLKTSSSVCGTTGRWQNRQEGRLAEGGEAIGGCLWRGYWALGSPISLYFPAATKPTALFCRALLSRHSALLAQSRRVGRLCAQTENQADVQSL